MAASDLRRVLIGVLISLLSIAAVLYFVDLAALWQALRLADYRYLPPAIAVFLVSLVARAVAWRTLLQEQVSVQKAFWVINEGYLLNNILPFRLGEVGRAFLMSGSTPGLRFWEVASTIVIERTFDVALSLGLLLASLPFIVQTEWAGQAALGSGVIVVLGLAGLHLMARYRQVIMGWSARLGGRWPLVARVVREERLNSFFEGLSALTDFPRFLKALTSMGVVWGLTLLEYYLVLAAFLPGARLVWAAFGLAAAAIGVSVPSSPGYIGVYEAAIVTGLSVFEIDPSVALAFAITVHVLYVLLTALLGAYGLARDGQSLGTVFRRVRQEADAA